MAKFLNNISLEQANDIQFKNTAGTNTGKIEADGNNLVLSNAVGDILLGDGASDVYIGDGTNSVDILFEQSGSIKADASASGVTLTLGSSNTTLAFGGATSFADIVTAFSGVTANTTDVGTSAKPFKDIYAAHHVGGSSINYATSRGWVEDSSPIGAQVGYFGGNFTRNGDDVENEIVWGLDPFNNKALLWKAIGNTSDDDDDGGWNKDITIPANNNIGYLSYVYFRTDFTPDQSEDGQIYLGCGTTSGQTLNVNGTSNTNPYFVSNPLNAMNNGGAVVANRWYLMVGIIQAYNNSTTDTDTLSGTYDVETGEKIMSGAEYKMGNNTTGQRHRTYLYYQDSNSAGNVYFWNPGFHAIDGSEPKIQDLVKRQVYLGDNVKAAFGDSDDLQIYHDGSNSYIKDAGAGVLNISSNQINLNASNGHNGLQINEGAGVRLRYNNSVVFDTVTAGITVTGDVGATTVTASGEVEGGSLDINGNADISGNLTMNNGGTIDQGTIYIQDQNGGRIGWNRNTSNGAIHNSSYNAFQAQVNTSGADGKFEIQAYTGAGGYGGSFFINVNAQPIINDYIIHNGDDDTHFGFSGANDFRVKAGGSDRFQVSGDVGVLGTTDFFIQQGRKLLLDGAGGHTYIEEESDSNLKFYVAGSERLNITNTSNNFAGSISAPSSFNFTGNNGYIKVGSSWNTGVLHFLNGPTTYLQFDVPNGRIQNNLGSYLTASSGTAKFGSFDNQSMSLVTNNTARLTIDTSGDATFGGNITLGDGHTIADDADDNLEIKSSSGEYVIVDGAVAVILRDGGDTKLQTKSGGVDITGELEATSLDINGNADISGETSFKPKHYGASDDLNSDDRSIFSSHATGNSTSNRPINYSTIYTLGGSGSNALQISTNEDYSEAGMWIRQYNANSGSPQGTGWQNWTEVWTTNKLTETNKTNYDTAYTHSQSAHAPSNAQANVAPTTAQVKTALNSAIGSNELTVGDANTTVAIPGNITVTGVTTMSGGTVVNTTTNTAIKDTTIVLNSGVGTQANIADIGLIFDRGSHGNAFMGWDESEDEFAFVKTTSEGADDVDSAAGITITNAETDYLHVKVGTLESVGNITLGGSNVLTVTSNANTFPSGVQNSSITLPTDFVSAASGGTFGGNVTVGSNSLTAGSLDINGNADISGTYTSSGDKGNAGFIQTFENTNTGTSSYVEATFGSGNSSELRIGHAPNYSSADWNASWVYAVGKPLFLKSSTGNVVISAGGSTSSAVVATFDTSLNTTFAGDITLGANHIGRDGDNYIGFETDNLIKFRVAGATQVKISDGVFAPQTDSDVDLGSNSTRFKDAYIDTITTTGAITAGGQITGTSLDINGNADISGALTLGTALAVAEGGTGATNLNALVQTTGSQTIGGYKTFTSDITISDTYPKLLLTDTDSNDDWSIINNNGDFLIYNETDSKEFFRADEDNEAMQLGDGIDMTYDGISTSNSGTVVRGGFLNPAAEANMVHLPHLINDLAGFNKWSNGTITVSGLYNTRSGSAGSYSYSNAITASDGGWGNAFDSHSSTAGSWYSDNGTDGVYSHGTDTPGVITLEWPNEATYSLWAGIVFGSGSFTATYVKIEAYRGGAWQTECEITNNTDNVVLRQVANNSGTNSATTKLRYTLGGSVNGSYFRIHSLYMANYRAGDNNLNNTGTDTTRGVNFIEKYKNGYLHGNLYPGADDTYDLGSSSYQWQDAYFDGTVNADSLDIDGNADISGDITGVSNITSTTFTGILQGAVTGAPDTTIWRVSGQYPTWGIFYDENTPDVIQFKANGSTNASIALDNGKISGGELEGTSLDINGNADISGNLSGVDTLTATTFVGALTGNASTATVADQATNLNAIDDRDMAPEDRSYSDDFRIFFTSKEGLEDGTSVGSNWQDALFISSYSDSSGGNPNVLAFDKSEKKIYHYQASATASNWGTPKQIAYTDSSELVQTTGGQTISGTKTFTGGLVLDDGSGAAPIIKWRNGNDDEFSLFNNSSGKLIFQQASTTRMDLSSGGLNVVDGIQINTVDVLASIDEDNMASNSATRVPTQQSVKAYVDSSVSSAGGGDVTLSGTQTFTGAKTFTDTLAFTGTGRITGIDTVSSGTDAANKTYVDTMLPKAGGTMSGAINILTDNTSEGAMLKIENDGTGDAVIDYVLTGANMWRAGIDNSDSDKFKWGIGTFGSYEKMSLSTGGNLDVAGDVNVGDDLNITGDQLTFINDAASAYIRAADALFIESDFDNDDSSSKPIYFRTNGTEMARMEATVTTFAGNVTLSSTAPILYLANTTSSTGKTWRFSSAANGNAYIAQDGVIDAITLSHTTGNATFAGIVSVPTGKSFRLYNAAGSGWGEITLNETDNKIQFNRGITPSGNEQADQTLGLATKRWHTVYAHDGDFSGDATFAGDVTVTGGDMTITKQNGSPVINMLRDANDPGANTLLHHLNFAVDYGGTHQDWGGIEHRTTSSSTRTKLNLNVKSTSGAVLNALSLDGTTDGTTATFAGDIYLGSNHIGRDSHNFIDFATDNHITFKTDQSTALQIDSNQSVKVVSGSLQISGDNANYATLTESGAGILTVATADDFIVDAAGDIILDAADNDVLFKDAGTHIGTINMSSSNLSIISSVSDKDIIFKGNDGGSSITALTLDISEAGKATFNNDVVAFSDRKLKENIQTLDGKKVLDMRGVSFTRKDTGLPSSGVIAQEIQEVAPELVSETDGTLGVSYGNLVGYLIEAVKDQQKQIDELKAIINGSSK